MGEQWLRLWRWARCRVLGHAPHPDVEVLLGSRRVVLRCVRCRRIVARPEPV